MAIPLLFPIASAAIGLLALGLASNQKVSGDNVAKPEGAGAIKPAPVEPSKKRGRPKKSVDKATDKAENQNVADLQVMLPADAPPSATPQVSDLSPKNDKTEEEGVDEAAD